MKPRLYALLSAFLLATTAHAQLPPEQALKTFKVADGLEISLWASEPMCVNPTCMDIDHKGRVWLCESVNYRTKLRNQPTRRKEGDRIVVLEDKKGGGRADTFTEFYSAPDILAPLGIAVAPYPDGKGVKVYVCHSPDILVFEDKDGDLRADGPPTKLLTGFKGYDHDHGVHGILIGPDGKLYFTVGDQGVHNLQSSDGKGRKWTSNSTDCRAGTVWRCDLDGKNLELIAHNFRNNYEPCVDSFGTIFLSDNDDDGNQQTRICYVMPGGNYGYHPRGRGETHWHEEQPGVVPKMLRTGFGSPTGICMYEGTLLPKKYHGQILHTDAGPRQLRCYHLKPNGAGYKAEQENMVESSDTWFRPSDVCVAPDGSVFIADWYDPGVGGHGIGDFTRGRIYRVAPKGHLGHASASAEIQTSEAFVEMLGSPNLAARARALGLMNKEDPVALKGLVLGMKEEANPFIKRRAYGNYFRSTYGEQGFSEKSRQLLKKLTKEVFDAEHPPIAWEWTILVRNRYAPIDFLRFMFEKPNDARIRARMTGLGEASRVLLREDCLSLQHISTEDLLIWKDYFYALAREYDGKDRFYLAALGIAVGHPGISAEIDKRREIILADFDKHFPAWNDKVAGLIWELRPPGMVAMLEKRLADPKLTATQRLQVVDILATAPGTAAGEAMLTALAQEPSPDVREQMLLHVRQNLPAKWAGLKKSPQLTEAIDRALRKPELRVTGLSLIAASEDAALLPRVLKALDAKEASIVRQAAVQTLGTFKNAQATEALADLLLQGPADTPEALRAELVAALGRQGTDRARTLLHEVAANTKKYGLPLRQVAVAGLAGTKEGTAWLIDAYKGKKLEADLTSDLTRLLRNSPFQDLRKQANKVLPAPPKLDVKRLPSIPALLARRGDAERGKQVMALTLKNDAQCLKCHTIHGAGGNVGPDLSAIGSKASRENLLESILYPSRAINHQYESWTVETQGGLVLTGLLVEDKPGHIILRDANAKDHKLAAGDIASKMKSPVSIMPADAIVHIPEDDLVDMVEYLYSLKGSGGVPTSWNREKARHKIVLFSYAEGVF
jgi:putative membrane-bound dehydrogenase-like protein